MQAHLARRCVTIVSILAFICLSAFSDTFSTTKVGQGVYYKKNHYNSLYGAQRDVYVLDANLNTPEVALAFPYRTGSSRATTSFFASTTPRAVGAVNGQFFNSGGVVQY